MIPSLNSFDTATDHLQTKFLAILPTIERCARCRFHAIRCAVRKADVIAETVAICWRWFVRLAERGKDGTAFATTLASHAVQHVKAGRGLCGQEHGKDVLSFTAQRRHGFKVEHLSAPTRRTQGAREETLRSQDVDEVEDRLRDNTQTPVPEQAAFRIDWQSFFQSLSGRDRRLARYLSMGHSALSAAHKFGVSPGRVTQLRQRWCRDWSNLQDAEVCARRLRLRGRPRVLASA